MIIYWNERIINVTRVVLRKVEWYHIHILNIQYIFYMHAY